MKHLTTFTCALILMAAMTGSATAEETSRTMAMEFRLGTYLPDIDSEFSGDVKPFDTVFGNESAWTYGLEVDAQFWQKFGSLGIFGITSYGYLDGKGIESGSGTASSDETTLSVLPLVGGVVYRFDVLAVKWNIPFVFTFKGGLDYTVWWIRDGVEDISDPDGLAQGYGGTFGLFGAAGLHLLLDVFEPHTAKVFDNDLGVNNSYLFLEYAYYWVNDFGSDSSFDLSHGGLFFGLAFEM
jgi:hypothetical protein